MLTLMSDRNTVDLSVHVEDLCAHNSSDSASLILISPIIVMSPCMHCSFS